MQPSIVATGSGSSLATYQPPTAGIAGSESSLAERLAYSYNPLGFSPDAPLGFQIFTMMAAPSQANTDFHSRAPMMKWSLEIRWLFVAPEPTRYLTIEEQRVFHTALRRSARLIYKAARVNK